MAIKTIISSDEVIARMILPDVEGVSDTVDSHLTTAHIRFQTLLETVFEPTIRFDTFWLEEGKFPVVQNKFLNLRLTQAFVKSAGLIVKGGDNLTPTSILSAPDIAINLQKGILYVSEDYLGSYVTVSYSAGFDADNKAPDWLKESVLAYMPFLLTNQVTPSQSKESITVARKTLDISGDMVEPYMRGVSFQYRPIF